MDQLLTRALDGAWTRNLDTQERRVAAQERAIVALLSGTLDTAGRQFAATEAHKLAGTLGSFGLNDGSNLASQLEAAWSVDPEPAAIAQLAAHVAELRKVLAANNPTESEPRVDPRAADAQMAEVILVDDDVVFADFVVETLQSASRHVTWFSEAESARKAMCGPSAALRPHVVLLDVEMPGTDGFALLQELGRHGLTRESSVVMVTRRTTAEDIVRARKLGAVDYLAKPLDAPMLLDRVSRAAELAVTGTSG